MTEITIPNLTLVLSIISICGAMFTVYLYFRNPQIKTDQDTIRLRDELTEIQRQIKEIKETHIRSVEADIKTLTTAVNELSKTVVKLSTIIDERIPRSATP
jgi:Tfp pilus assembly protein PilN